MAKTVNPTTNCNTLSPACIAQTSTTCANCTGKIVTYFKNFTNPSPSTTTIGTWYYQFKFNDAELTGTSGTDYSVTITKDNTNISYGGAGNDSTVEIEGASGNSANLTVRVFDIDRNSFAVTSPNATVIFKLLYSGTEKVIGQSTTNATGYATLRFEPCVRWKLYWRRSVLDW